MEQKLSTMKQKLNVKVDSQNNIRGGVLLYVIISNDKGQEVIINIGEKNWHKLKAIIDLEQQPPLTKEDEMEFIDQIMKHKNKK